MTDTKELIIFNTVQKAFCWAFSERENLQRIKSEFKLNDEIESISDVTNVLDSKTLENYLIENSYIYKNGKTYEFEY